MVERGDDALCDLGDVAILIEAAGDDRELVAAEPAAAVARTQHVAQPDADLDEGAVARVVSEAVVDSP